jgi:hypothetical protein
MPAPGSGQHWGTPVNSHHDQVDSWLDADVDPLPPPPGTFEQISAQARHRKTRRAIVSVAGAAVLVTGLAITPRVAGSLLSHPAAQSSGIAVGHASSAASPSARPAPSKPHPGHGTMAVHSSTPIAPPTPASSLSPTGSGAPVPADFKPSSVTFVGTHTGAVLGHARIPGKCGPLVPGDCTSLAGTSDYGQTWYGVSAPVTGAPAGSAGVSEVRFLNTSTGWAFGPELWVTHDGGAHWTPEKTYGLRVTGLETAGARAFALFARCTGGSTDFAAHCTSFSLYSSNAASRRWGQVPGPTGHLTLPAGAAGRPAAASLVLAAGPVTAPAAGTGYLLAPSGAVLSGPLTGAPWTMAGKIPCSSTVAPPAGQPARAVFAAGSNELFVACTSAAANASGVYVKTVYASTDGGKSWPQVGSVYGPGIATSLAAAQGNLVVLATTTCIDLSADGGGHWRQVYPNPPGAAQGQLAFSYIGMTDPLHGVAVPADASLHEIFITHDGGRTWQPSVIQGG